MKVEIIRKREAKMPLKFTTERDMREIGQLVEDSILTNIRTQTQTSGARLKMNAPSTRERKRRLGRALLSLVDEKHRFVKGGGQSWVMSLVTKNMVRIRPSAAVKKLSEELQAAGYVGWFGINKTTKELIRHKLRGLIVASFAKARRG